MTRDVEEDWRSARRAFDTAVVGRTVDAVRGLGRLGRSMGSALGLAPRRSGANLGAPAGIEHTLLSTTAPRVDEVRVHCIDYGPDKVEYVAVDDLDAFMSAPRPPPATVRWINVDGLHPQVVDRFRRELGFHTLVAEDVLHVPQRPRLENNPDHVFLIMRMVRLDERGELLSEQVSLFLFEDLVLTFQEAPGDVFEPVRGRIQTAGSRVRQRDASFLAYALVDAVVDHCFPLLERYADLIDDLEDLVMYRPEPRLLQRVIAVKKELTALRRIMWPTRDMVDAFATAEGVPEDTQAYVRDVHTHTLQLVDVVESHRDTAGGLVDLYMSVESNKMNEVMKVLTVIATLFIPLSFIAGVYGMNFKYFPELEWRYAYGMFWVLVGSVATGLLWYFRRRGWI